MSPIRGILSRLLPGPIYRKLVLMSRNPPIGRIDFGDLRSLKPISDVWGLDRGTPVDRYYIEEYLTANSDSVKGHVLEVGDNTYTRRHGRDKVTKSDVLHVSPRSKKATIIADLRQADHIPSNQFDCIICTQTLHFIFEVSEAVSTLYRILKPGGTLLVTLPGIAQVNQFEMKMWGDYWRFTSASVKRLFTDSIKAESICIKVFGNVLSATAFLHGIAAEELRPDELDYLDINYELMIGVCLVKGTEAT